MENKLKILAVDDSTINLATIEQELKGKYEVITVNSGVRAIQYLKNHRPDLILLDIQMALKDGIETLKEIRELENGNSIPVIMLTSKQDKESIIESTKLGALDYVLKPFNSQNLQERIIRTLKRAGVIEVKEIEIYERIKEVSAAIRDNDIRSAINRIDEVLRLKIDEEISGRLQNARFRLKSDDTQTALRLVDRVLQILERFIRENSLSKLPISNEEMYTWFQRILQDLQDFKVHEASQKIENLQAYLLPDDIQNFCNSLQMHLEEYDDGAAEDALRKKLLEGKLM